MSTPFVSTKDYALAFAERGLHILPLYSAGNRGGTITCTCRHKESCQSPAKHPMWRFAPNGLKNATTDTTIIKKWFGGFGKQNLGIVTGSISGIIALDIDKKHGGYETLAALEAKYGALPSTLRFNTGGGGIHILFRHPGKEIRNSVGHLGSGIDVRGDGGYIVAPPSLHVSGNTYSIAKGCNLDTPLANAPAWLLQLMRQGGSNSGSMASRPSIEALVRGAIPEGQRNTTIARISGLLIAKRVDTRVCLELMQAFNEARCTPPLDAEEVARVVTSIDCRAFAKITNRI